MKFRIRSIYLLVFGFLLTFLIVTVGYQDAHGQRRKNTSKNKRIGKYRGGSINFGQEKRYWAAGFHINSTNYFGDITPNANFISSDFSSTRMGVGASLSYRIWSNITITGGLGWNRLSGDDFKSADPQDPSGYFRYVRNLHFRNDIFEFSAIGAVDLMHNRGTYFVRHYFVPYVFGGVAVFYHNPQGMVPQTDLNGQPLEKAGKWVALRPLGTEGQFSDAYDVKPYSPVQLALPFGAGVRYRVNNYIDLEFEVGYRFLFTDYIDDVSLDYVDLGALDSDLARSMSFRSLEPNAVASGKSRNLETWLSPEDYHQVVSPTDGNTYHVLAGYGHDQVKNLRGNPNDNDHYIVTSIKIKYILHAAVRKAKYR